ncbi:Tumor necrosis factor alpha-induced protein 8-like protein 3 [Macaca mulatta]|uniref:Tumor necrosis factor alpha-induced protein 8-like protein 3 n=2 Tax=Macaca TaxID=9539 RepID=G7MXA9_MACMU|nr:Tumor necrosis factor alpha-induced protein 8-like protein 3 [Macaca mulatta]EHH63078.1 Tumor necrosis factor alpha-induced protein 8-like protein 3 [Macaca fascicularis]
MGKLRQNPSTLVSTLCEAEPKGKLQVNRYTGVHGTRDATLQTRLIPLSFHLQRGKGLGPDVFSSKSLALQAQKKILSKIASKTVANMLIDDTSSEIFDELYKVTKEHTHNKKEAHKIMKDLIKVAIKIGILYRNNQFSQEELVIVEKFRKKLNQTAMTIVSFYEVEYTFDRNVLSNLLHECKDLVHELVQRHLTPRTHGRINHVFNHFANVEFLSTLYSLDGDCRPNLKRICEGINKLLDEKVL